MLISDPLSCTSATLHLLQAPFPSCLPLAAAAQECSVAGQQDSGLCLWQSPQKKHRAETVKGRNCVKPTLAKKIFFHSICYNKFKYFILIFLKGGDNRKKTVKKKKKSPTSYHHSNRVCTVWRLQLWTYVEKKKDQVGGQRTGLPQHGEKAM